MTEYDYIIIGAGSAGCTLANRLSANTSCQVLLIEAGAPDSNPLLHIPKGFGKTLSNQDLTWRYTTERRTHQPNAPEVWLRGKTLGGSSSVNGMVYNRGQPEDYDNWAAMGNKSWSWSQLAPHFEAIEQYVSSPSVVDATSEAVIKAGEQMGLPRRDGFDGLGREGIGYIAYTINKGRRMSSARIFLAPVLARSNLHLLTDSLAQRILFEARQAVGVRVEAAGQQLVYRARREIILAAGGLESPKLLQLSGVGPAEHLKELGIDVILDSPGVGANLREHFLLGLQFRVKRWHYSKNREYSGIRLWRNACHYLLRQKGLLSTGSHDVAGFVRVRPGSSTPDAQLMLTPTSRDFSANKITFEQEPGLQMFGYVLRPESQGRLLIRSADPSIPPMIEPNYLSCEYDRTTSIALVKYIRELMSSSPLEEIVDEETRPGAQAATDEQILDAFERFGQSGFHTVGTCKMGTDPLAVVDDQLRVRGLKGLRVVDCSVFPTMISGNTNGPVMAVASRAAELILSGGGTTESVAHRPTAAEGEHADD